MSELEDFLREKDEFFRDHPQSPLSPEQRRHFKPLRHYAENAALRLHVRLDTDVAHDVIEMDTSTGDKQTYTRAGSITFQSEGQEAVLYLYSNGEGQEAVLYLYSSGDRHQLFLPFRDATSGKETYGAGRYLEADLAEDGTVMVDFNYAYNPYCAYNDAWSCPIPPNENWLKLPIRAGEMAFEGEGAGH